MHRLIRIARLVVSTIAAATTAAPATIFSLDAGADSYIRSGNKNEGAASFLRVRRTGTHRALIRFDQSQLSAALAGGVLQSATLQLFIEDNSNSWSNGREIDVHRLLVNWTELGVTFNCPIDTNPANSTADCDTQWNGGSFATVPSASYLQSNAMTGPVSLDVTADIAAFASGADNFGWIIKKRAEGQNGSIDYGSREGTTTHRPRLVLDVFFPPTNTPTHTPTATPTATPTHTPSLTATQTPTLTPNIRCGAAPLAGCRQSLLANKSSLQLRKQGGAKDKLVFKWLKGEATGVADLGNPALGTTYTLCVYDEIASQPSLVVEAVIPPAATCGNRPCWKSTRKGYKYSDRLVSTDGMRVINLKSGAAGKAKILVKAQGTGIGLPALPLQQQPRVIVQLKNDHAAGECWEAQFSGPAKKNDNGQFKDKGDAPVTFAPTTTPTNPPFTPTATPATTAATATPGMSVPTPTPTPTVIETPGGGTCGNGFLQPGEFYTDPVHGALGDLSGVSCPLDAQVQPCTAAGLVTFAVGLVPPLGAQPTSATILIGYRSDLLRLPAASGSSTITRVTWPSPLPFVRGATDFDYALRVVTVRTGPIDPDNPIFSVQFDTCDGQPVADPAMHLGCIVEGCASTGGPVSDCTCVVY